MKSSKPIFFYLTNQPLGRMVIEISCSLLLFLNSNLIIFQLMLQINPNLLTNNWLISLYVNFLEKRDKVSLLTDYDIQDTRAEGKGRAARLQRRLLVVEVEKAIMQYQSFVDQGRVRSSIYLLASQTCFFSVCTHFVCYKKSCFFCRSACECKHYEINNPSIVSQKFLLIYLLQKLHLLEKRT